MGRKGEIALSGKLRDRDDGRRYGLSKALRGLDLGSHDTAKTRHYARAILQDKTAFPIDTNVIQAILGGKNPTPNEAAKLISLANEFAGLHKIETGAAGLQAAIFKSNSKFSEAYTPDTVRSALSGIKGRAGGYVPNFAKILIAAKYYDGLKVGKAKGVEISKTGEVKNVGREVFGGIGFSTSRIGKGFASAVRTSAPTTSLKKASQQAGVTKSIIVPVVASSAINDPVPDNLKTNEALLQQFLANHPQPKEVVASLSQQGFNVKSILSSHSGSEIKSIIDILSSNSFNKGILNKSANELKDPKLVKFFAPGGIKAKGPKGTYAFGSSIAEMQQGEYASKVLGKHKSYPILVTGKSGPGISEPINAEEIFPGITDNKNRLFFSSVYQFGTRVLDTDNPEHMELLGRLGYSQKILQQENLMAGGYVPNFAESSQYVLYDTLDHQLLPNIYKNKKTAAQAAELRNKKFGKFKYQVFTREQRRILFEAQQEKNPFNAKNFRSSGYIPNFAREKIIAAAFKTKKGNIFTGSYHGAAYEKIPEGENIDLIDGFVTNSGKFVDRKEAGLIAQAAHQLYNNGNNRRAFASNNCKLDTAFLPLPQENYHSSGFIPNFLKPKKPKIKSFKTGEGERVLGPTAIVNKQTREKFIEKVLAGNQDKSYIKYSKKDELLMIYFNKTQYC
jgi:hypothetical protein